MALEVLTNDASALTDDDLAEMIAIEGAFDLAFLDGCRESWVLVTTARDGGTLHGYAFSTLERIGGTPCVLLGVMSVRRNAKRDTVLKGLMKEAFHRALMAFPDEDVVVGGRFALPDGLQALKEVDDVIPAPGSRAVGEERAWGRRLAKRFGVDGSYVAEQFMSTKNPSGGFVDFESAKPEKIAASIKGLFEGVDASPGGVLIAYGWTMAEDLAK
ncbi:MAG TPA: hypothetical protein DEB38_09265, partial [Acidimicrobiaceae bacterium]|nr:hypothetical protein [Acidimicrobiaceae bacterium]